MKMYKWNWSIKKNLFNSITINCQKKKVITLKFLLVMKIFNKINKETLNNLKSYNLKNNNCLK